MSRFAAVPDFGDSGSLYQYVEVAEPGEPGYPTPRAAGERPVGAGGQPGRRRDRGRPAGRVPGERPLADLEPEAEL